MQYIEPMAKLIENFRSLPGIGSKTAVRLAYHVLDMDKEKAKALAEAIIGAKEKVGFCQVCYNLTDTNPCRICGSEKRDHSVICVVEQPQDVAAMERMRDFKGVYHVLHGAISPSRGIGPTDIRLKELMTRLADDVDELIIATNSNLEGEATAMYISKLVKPTGIKLTRIASGVPVGGDLEYIDEVTLYRALEGRVQL